jgi:hypothetical protein
MQTGLLWYHAVASQVTGIVALDALSALTTLELGSNRIRTVSEC